MATTFDTAYVVASIPALIDGLGMTILVSAISIALATAIGVVGAALRLFRVPVLDRLVRFYVEFIRNTPLLAQLFFIFYGLPGLGLKLSLFWSGVVER